MNKLVFVALAIVVLTSCAHGNLPAPPPGLTVSPDGTGYCCEPHRYGSCRFYEGGYRTRSTSCVEYVSDASWVPTTREFVDAHGCVHLDRATAMSCIAFDLGLADVGPAVLATIDTGP